MAFAPEVAIAYDVIGQPEAKKAVLQAMQYFGPVYPRDRDTRCEMLSGSYMAMDEGGEEPFKAIDEWFFSVDYGDWMRQWMQDYISNNDQLHHILSATRASSVMRE